MSAAHIKPWRERMAAIYDTASRALADVKAAADTEVAELRAALEQAHARQLELESPTVQQPAPVAGDVLPCPFCGSAAHVDYDRMGLATNARVHCVAMDCRADVWSPAGKDAAIAMWNRRAAPVPAACVQHQVMRKCNRFGHRCNCLTDCPATGEVGGPAQGNVQPDSGRDAAHFLVQLPYRLTAGMPSHYRLGQRGGVLVLQGWYSWQEFAGPGSLKGVPTAVGGDWRDLPTVDLDADPA